MNQKKVVHLGDGYTCEITGDGRWRFRKWYTDEETREKKYRYLYLSMKASDKLMEVLDELEKVRLEVRRVEVTGANTG